MYVAMEILPLCTKYSLSQIHASLRDIDIYCVAIPVEQFGTGYHAGFPGKTERYPYALWICMNGEAEYQEKLNELKITKTENVQRLQSQTGLLSGKHNREEEQ